ncbi:MAG: hypothetical protein ACRC92_26695 [Peptostreptococcaceae bacterium]
MLKVSRHALYRFANRMDEETMLNILGTYYRPRKEIHVKMDSCEVITLQNELLKMIDNSIIFYKGVSLDDRFNKEYGSETVFTYLFNMNTSWVFVIDDCGTVVSCYETEGKKELVQSILSKRISIMNEIMDITQLAFGVTSSKMKITPSNMLDLSCVL